MVAALISAGLAFVVVFVVVLISQKNPILGPLLAALPIQFSCELFGLLLSGKDIDPFLVATTKAWLTGAFSITVFLGLSCFVPQVVAYGVFVGLILVSYWYILRGL